MISRRTFVAGTGAVAASSLLSACGLPIQGDPVGGQTNIRVINWFEYIDPATIPVIEAEAAIGVNYDEGTADNNTYPDNVTAWDTIISPQLSGGGVPNFDLIMPTNWLAARMIDRGWVEPLPLDVIPNHINIDPAFLTNDWDRGSRFQMPWQGGMTGIAYNPVATDGQPVTSIEQLLSPDLAGRVGLIGEMREAVGLAMLFNGDDPSSPTPSSARAGLEVLENAAARGQFQSVVFFDFVDKLQSGELAATMAWSGQTALLQLDRPDIEFVIPEEGAISWFDTMVIPKNAPGAVGAARWMNWAYDPANAAQISAFNLYVCPVLGTQVALREAGEAAQGASREQLLDASNNELIFPSAETRNQLFTWGTLDEGTELEIEDKFNTLIESIG